MQSQRSRSRAILDAASSVAVIVAAGILIYRAGFATSPTALELKTPEAPIQLNDAPVMGAAKSEAVLIVYSDFQCPYCARFAREVLPEIERKYVETGRTAVAFRHLPLPNHAQAMPAAISSECAGQQNRFWEMHDKLFEQATLDEKFLEAVPQKLELNAQQFRACLSDSAVQERIRMSVSEAGRLGINSTPTFLIGTRLPDGRVQVIRTVVGLQPPAVFFDRLDAVLTGKSTGWRSWLPWV